MIEFVKNLFASDFMPHGSCYLWDAGVVRLHVLSDSLITLAYYSIPVTLAYFVRKRRDVPYRWMFLLFCGFIVACGTTHLMEVWTVWHGTYRLAGFIKAVTAVLSIGTALLLVRIVPEALKLSSPKELARLNRQLEAEVQERRRAEEALHLAHEKLELRVKERTEELARANAALEMEMAERQRALSTLEKSQSQLAGIINSAMDAIITVDEDQRITVFNGAAEQMFVCTAAEALGQPLDRFIPERFRRAHREHVPAFGRNHVTRRRMGALGTVHGLRANGEEFPIEASISHLEAGGRKYYTVILRDITERERAEKSLRHYAAIVEASDDAIIGKDLEGKVTSWNRGAEKLFGYTAAEMVGQSISLIIPPEQRAEEAQMLADFRSGETVRRFETTRCRKDGTLLDIAVTLSPIKDAAGNILGAAKVVRDTSEQKRAKQELMASLLEKEVLLKEIHHRVKNNLQVISSLLSLQSGYIRTPEVLAMLKEDQNRIQSMALVHEKLYRSGSLSRIEFGEYLQNLAASLIRTVGVGDGAISLKTDVEKVYLGVDAAIPCGLIVNELISNTLKHAFADGRSGEIRVGLHLDAQRNVILTVGDNGPGLPSGLDFRHTESLGLQLVNTLTGQLHGTIEVRMEGGTEFRLVFALLNHNPKQPHLSA